MTSGGSLSGPTLAVVGAGTWGTTLALLLARRGRVTLLARDEAHARRLTSDGENRRYLPGVGLPAEVLVTADPADLGGASDLVVLAVPAGAMRSVASALRPHVPPGTALLSAAKGLEAGTLTRMTQVIAAELPGVVAGVAALSGPNLAPEIARGLPAAAVVAAADEGLAARVVSVLGSTTYRLYRNADVVGVELAGALKNIVAIVAGAADALGMGDNGKAAITTRGLAEITRLGAAMGANPLTFAGLAGIGDVMATCASPLSRNHRLGAELAAGRSWAQVEGSLPGVAEGAYTVRAALELARNHGVELPLAREVYAVLYEGKSVRRSLEDLLARESREELAGLG
jgi:glycerol-3-phosphate dehydrogenase (NAD(P)+)